MFLENRRITLEIPDELSVSRLWWCLTRLNCESVDKVLAYAESLPDRALNQPSYFERDDDEDDEPIDDCDSESQKPIGVIVRAPHMLTV